MLREVPRPCPLESVAKRKEGFQVTNLRAFPFQRLRYIYTRVTGEEHPEKPCALLGLIQSGSTLPEICQRCTRRVRVE